MDCPFEGTGVTDNIANLEKRSKNIKGKCDDEEPKL